MIRAFVRTAAALVAVVGLMAATSSSNPASWTTPTTPFNVIGNVYYVGTEGISVWLITSPKGHILIDGGMPGSAALVEANIRALGFKITDVKLLLNTHAHFDHAGALAQLKKDAGKEAVMVSSVGDRSALERGVYAGSEDVAAWAFPPVKVDGTVADGGTVTVGPNNLTAVLMPGHTAGCTSWTMGVKDSAGVTHKIIFFCSASVGANRLAPKPQYPTIVADYQKTFARAGRIDPDIFLAPHAEQFGLVAKRAAMGPGKPNPFIVPGEYAKAMADYQAAFEKELARQQGAKS
ncbi:metallo-beta-lactamase class B [Caulobacter ginsengisoli]|uniref:Metallo-beta-lactamase class B n=1 Tax=Caulobacter ginsengisoli TaxID=400775 RepID=A0ABU0INP6_9CAUL|nr:subclass B3 metallo-beta-lactamase [Caulobacter ginsengisoli]MDQ0463579.1 metallo-beta-lactamase class B [Caulobacter ginsengisoli]